MCGNSSSDELNEGNGRIYALWLFSTRYIAPVAVVLEFLNAVGFSTGLDGLSCISINEGNESGCGKLTINFLALQFC